MMLGDDQKKTPASVLTVSQKNVHCLKTNVIWMKLLAIHFLGIQIGKWVGNTNGWTDRQIDIFPCVIVWKKLTI